MEVWAIVLAVFTGLLLVVALVVLIVKWYRVKRAETRPPTHSVKTRTHSPDLFKREQSQPSLMHIDALGGRPHASTSQPYSPITSDSECDFEDRVPTGKLEFAFNYEEDREELMVHLIRAIGLPNTNGLNVARYVEVYLLPFRMVKGQTKVKYDTSNPIFNEQFLFEGVASGDLSNRTLQFCVFEFDAFSRHTLVGEVMYTFDEYGKGRNGSVLVREIQKDALQEKPTETTGAVLLSMCYLPTASRLTFVVLKAKINSPDDNSNTVNPPDLYAKTTLRQAGKRIRTTKTSVVRGTLTPVYNEAFVFDLPSRAFSDIGIVVRVIDNSTPIKQTVGHVTLGPHALTSMGIHHWNTMIKSPRKPIAQWHPLVSE